MELIFLFIFLYIIILLLLKIIKIFNKGILYERKISEMIKKENEKMKSLSIFYERKISEMIKKENEKIKSLNIELKKLTEKKLEITVLEKQKENIALEYSLKKDLANYTFNKTMEEIFNEYLQKKFEIDENFFYYKKNPSYKAVEYIRNIKKSYKDLELENKKMKLLLSEFIAGEKENLKIEKEEDAIKYSEVDKIAWNKLPYIEKLDIILKKYKERWKDKLNIGIEFERYCGYLLEKKGYSVKYWGIIKGKCDGGIDLIARKNNNIVYVQCKYWGNKKTIRENTIAQLFGAALKQAIDDGFDYNSFIKAIKIGKIKIVLMTKTELSEDAINFCKKLNIRYQENLEIEDYPIIKLVESDEKIFYIPTDFQYDNIIFYSTNKTYSRTYTCFEASQYGYRHSYKWRGN